MIVKKTAGIVHSMLKNRLFVLVFLGLGGYISFWSPVGFSSELEKLFNLSHNSIEKPTKTPPPGDGVKVFESWESAAVYLKEKHIKSLYLENLELDFKDSLNGKFNESQKEYVKDMVTNKDSYRKDFEIVLFQEWQKAGLETAEFKNTQALVRTKIRMLIIVHRFLIFSSVKILATAYSYVLDAQTGKLILIVAETEDKSL